MRIRKAHPADAPVIAQIGAVSFSQSFGHLYPEDVLKRYLQRTYASEKIRYSLTKENNMYFVAEENGAVVGFLKLKKNSKHNMIKDRKQIQLQKIYLLPERTGLGAGTLLMEFTKKLMDEFLPVTLWLMVYENNKGAITFYQRLGYETIGYAGYDFENIHVNFNVMKIHLT